MSRFPAGRTQLTFFSDRVGGAAPPVATASDFFVFSKDIGGGEWFQLYRYDERPATRRCRDRREVSQHGAVFSPKAISSPTPRRVAPAKTTTWDHGPARSAHRSSALTLQGGEAGAPTSHARSEPAAAGESVSANESYVWLVDLPSRSKFLLTPRGGDKVSYEGATFSRDKKESMSRPIRTPEFHRLAYVDLKTGAMTFSPLRSRGMWSPLIFRSTARAWRL